MSGLGSADSGSSIVLGTFVTVMTRRSLSENVNVLSLLDIWSAIVYCYTEGRLTIHG